MRVMIAVDGSNLSDVVLQEAASRPWPAGTEFSAVTAVDPFFFTRAPLLLEEAKRSSLQAIEEQIKPLKDAGWAVETGVLLDNPRHAIPRAAIEWKADLILLGSHGRGAVQRLLMGSTAQTVLRHAPCSVEVVRDGKEPKAGAMRVLIATDGSDYAQEALRSVAQRPWPAGTEFRVISSPEFPVLVGEYPYYSPDQMAELSKHSETHARDAVNNGVELLKKGGIEAETEVTEPKETPVQAILSAADTWGADLIVIGSHGHRGFDRFVMGSVSESVALHAHCSVEVVRKSGNAQAARAAH